MSTGVASAEVDVATSRSSVVPGRDASFDREALRKAVAGHSTVSTTM